MSRLELIMTDKKLTPDDARALLSDHVEGALDEATRAEVDALLAQDAALASERRRLAQTLALLKGLPAPEPPADIVGKVRDRLAAERRNAAVEGAMANGAPVDEGAKVLAPRSGWRRWGGLEAAVGLAAAASIAIFVAIAGHGSGASGSGGTHTAGIAEDERAVSATLVVPGIPHLVVTELAVKAGMDTISGDVFEGDRRAAGRFLIELKAAAAQRGVEVSGFVPDASRVRIEIRSH